MGRKVECEVFDIEIDGKPAVEANCLRCNHITRSFGTEEASVKRCLAMMRDECPNGESNFYTQDDE